MNQVSISRERKPVMLFVIVTLILAGAILVRQLLPLALTGVDAEVQPAPANDQRSGVTSEAAAPVVSPPQDLLERELKEAWRAQSWMPRYMDAMAARSQSILERDLKEVWRANVASHGDAIADLLGRDLKEIWQAQVAIGNGAASALEDRSGLERELKEVWRANLAAASDETPYTTTE